MKKDNYLTSLVLMLALLFATTAHAHEFVVDGIYYHIDGTTATVTYKGSSPDDYSNEYSGSVTIPATVTYGGITYPVTSIGVSAFNSCTALTSIDIPNSVTSIDALAFYGCTGLTSIYIPNSVTSIGVGAFDETSWFNNQPDGLVYAGLVAYKYKGAMHNDTSIIIRDGSLSIAEYAFYNCSNLTKIEIPNSVITIGSGAFSYCCNLTSIEIPNSVTFIGKNAFIYCSGLSSLRVASDNPCYDSRNNCNAIIETASNSLVIGCKKTIIPNSITSIGPFAFWGCNGLASIEIPNSVTSIGRVAFCDCNGLTSIEIPNSVTSIGNEAFESCDGLTSISIGNSVTNIGDFAFNACNKLTNIYCYATNPPTCLENTFDTYSATLHVPAASLATYFTAPYWENFENIIGDAIAPTGIIINNDSVVIQLTEQIRLMATVTPDNASNKEITWISTDTTVATVNNGVVLAVGYGECDIIASCFGMQAICHVIVANRITLDQQEAMLLPNHILTLTPTPIASNIYTVSSSNPTVAAARVLGSGIVQVVGIKEGTTTITVGSTDGYAMPATCLVTVYTEPGDLNSDGFVNIGDVTSLIDYLLGGDETSVTMKNADVNGDGIINIADVTSLIDTLLGQTE